MIEPAVCPLEDLALLCFRGPDTRKFLQGQLSNDVAQLAAGTLLRAGLHNPQGRTLALLALAAGRDEEEVLAILPRELLAGTMATLKRYILRAKVTISDESAAQRIHGLAPGADAGTAAETTGTTTSVALHDCNTYVYAGTRRLALTPAHAPAPLGTPLPRTLWRALDIAAGLPQVYLPTSGQFVAQMLNLDYVDAVSFKKGCYTGQEVIARAHFRGRVKRRMQRFVSEVPQRLVPGDTGQFADGRSFRVIESVQREDGRSEFLAVAALPGSAADLEPAGPTPPAPRIDVTALALPYELTD